MGPVNRITLHQGHRNRGARTLLDRHGLAEAVHGLVRMTERQVQEAEGIEKRLRRFPEGSHEGVAGGRSRERALGMPAHAVDHHEQCGMRGDGQCATILVVVATSDEAGFSVFEAQRAHRHWDRLPRFIHCVSGRRTLRTLTPHDHQHDRLRAQRGP